MKTVYDYNEQWSLLVAKAFHDFDSLTRDERVWFTVRSLIDAIQDGGLISHYYNSRADYNFETIEDLEYLGYTDMVKVLIKANTLFPGGRAPRDSEKRNEILESLDEEAFEKFFDPLEEKFEGRLDDLEKSLAIHIENKIKSISDSV